MNAPKPRLDEPPLCEGDLCEPGVCLAVMIKLDSIIVLNQEVFFAGASVVKLVGAWEEFGSSYLAASDLRDAVAQPL